MQTTDISVVGVRGNCHMHDMDQGARGWLLRTARRHFWRVASHYEFEDLVQDGYMHYARLVNKYPDVTSRSHIMRLFQITFINHLNDISKKKTRQPDVAVSSILAENYNQTDFFERNGGEEADMSNIMLAPKLVKQALQALGATKNAKAVRSAPRKRLNGTRETTNERLCRMAGLDPSSVNLHSALRVYLKPQFD